MLHPTMMMNTKRIGVILSGLCIILLFVVLSSINDINKKNDEVCGCPVGQCPMSSGLPSYIYLEIAVTLVLGIIGVYLFIRAGSIEREHVENEKKLVDYIKTLDEDEKKIYETIYRADGLIFQSDLVNETELPKAKVSRILDKLENKGLLERRRKGLNNIVLLKKLSF